MNKKGFGKVEFIAQKDVKDGYLLRENTDGMVLEFYDSKKNSVDVVGEFPKASIDNQSSFRTCLHQSREYIGCFNEPLQVDLTRRRT